LSTVVTQDPGNKPVIRKVGPSTSTWSYSDVDRVLTRDDGSLGVKKFSVEWITEDKVRVKLKGAVPVTEIWIREKK
jgi:hypothetical protein